MYAPQTLFRRFSVFAGGATLEAVGALNGDTPDEHGDSDALEGLAVLLDHSLLDPTDDATGAPRYRPLAEESLRYGASSGITWAAPLPLPAWAVSLMNLGLMVGLQGDHARAREMLEESLVLGRARDDVRNVAYALDNLDTFAVEEGDLARALIILQESLALHRDLGDTAGTVDGLEDMARIAPALDQPERAARLLGAAEALRSASGAARPRYLQALVEHMVASVRAALGMEAFDTAWAEGAALSLEQAIAATLASV